MVTWLSLRDTGVGDGNLVFLAHISVVTDWRRDGGLLWSSLNLQGTFSLGRRWIGGYLWVGKGSEATDCGGDCSPIDVRGG
jgi:hypothetical protein